MTLPLLLALGLASFQAEPAAAEIVSVKRVWDRAPYNAFTDLVRFRDRWFMTFREGKDHVSPDGALRVISSPDGETWESAALVTATDGDLRDPKLSVMPDGRLMLAGGKAMHDKTDVKFKSFVWVSDDGEDWSEPHEVGDPNFWVWRPAWHDGQGYAVGYSAGDERSTRLYSGRDGQVVTLVPTLFDKGYPSEAALAWKADGTALCLLRRDGAPSVYTNQIGTSKPPYTEWTWKDLGKHLGGPALLRLDDGRFVAAGRLHVPDVHTGLCWLDPDAGELTEFLPLPSNGDSSYPGLVFHHGILWVSYYSGHEGKTSIYLAKVKLPEKPAGQP